MTNWFRAFFLLGFVQLCACGSTVSMTRTGRLYPERAPNCNFQLFTSTIPSGYIEIGTIDVTTIGSGNRDSTVFYKEVQAMVCKAGGQAVVGYANGNGVYIKGSVLRVAPAAKAPVAVAVTSPVDLGCHYDTQCKGDRICKDGNCVDSALSTVKTPTPTIGAKN